MKRFITDIIICFALWKKNVKAVLLHFKFYLPTCSSSLLHHIRLESLRHGVRRSLYSPLHTVPFISSSLCLWKGVHTVYTSGRWLFNLPCFSLSQVEQRLQWVFQWMLWLIFPSLHHFTRDCGKIFGVMLFQNRMFLSICHTLLM